MLQKASRSSQHDYSSDHIKEFADGAEHEKHFFNVQNRDPLSSFYKDNDTGPLDSQERKMQEAYRMINKNSRRFTSFKDLQLMLQGQIIEKRQKNYANLSADSQQEQTPPETTKIKKYRYKF